MELWCGKTMKSSSSVHFCSMNTGTWAKSKRQATNIADCLNHPCTRDSGVCILRWHQNKGLWKPFSLALCCSCQLPCESLWLCRGNTACSCYCFFNKEPKSECLFQSVQIPQTPLETINMFLLEKKNDAFWLDRITASCHFFILQCCLSAVLPVWILYVLWLCCVDTLFVCFTCFALLWFYEALLNHTATDYSFFSAGKPIKHKYCQWATLKCRGSASWNLNELVITLCFLFSPSLPPFHRYKKRNENLFTTRRQVPWWEASLAPSFSSGSSSASSSSFGSTSRTQSEFSSLILHQLKRLFNLLCKINPSFWGCSSLKLITRH